MNKKLLIIIGIILGIICIIAIGGIIWYNTNLKAVNPNLESSIQTENLVSSENVKKEGIVVQIPEGTKTEQILDILVENNLIRNKFVAAIYIKLNGIKTLQAGKYELYQDMDLKKILEIISSGKIYDESVKITFLEGKNIRWIAKTIAEKTNNTEDDVYSLLKDEEYINSLIQKYWFLTESIKNAYIYYPLEGYLYPDTYIFENKDVSVKTIFESMLENADKVFSKYKEKIQNMNLTSHQMITIASIVELEGNDFEARKGIARVIYNRLNTKMSLGSDVTAYYAFKIDMGERNLSKEEINTFNPYNTRGPNMNGKIPVGPICCPSSEAIEATLNPSDGKYLYFVSDSNGKIYFTLSYEEHKNKIQELQKQGLWYEYK